MFNAPLALIAAVDSVPVIVGLALRTTVDPVPVVVAAMSAVPLPARTGVVRVVEIVMAGVVVAVATVPAKPFADTTEAEVTVPEEAAPQAGTPLTIVRTWPLVPIGNLVRVLVVFAYRVSPITYELKPVPP
jgi:hypothetical protein